METLSEVKTAINEEIDRIWLSEPEDIRTIRHGFFPSGVGTHGQYFSVLIMVGSETRNLAIHSLSNLVRFADSGQFSLEQLRYIAREKLRVTSNIIGFFGLRRLGEILTCFLEHIDEVDNVRELRELFADLFTLSNRYQMWLHQTFPWHLSMFFRKKTPEQVEEDLSIVKRLKEGRSDE
jgi:hypothetical protein